MKTPESPFSSSTSDTPPSAKRERPQPSSPLLECRFSREIYVVIGLWVLLGIAFQTTPFWSPRKGNFWEATAMTTLLFHIPNLFFIYWTERIRVWVEERGLRFRGLFQTRFVPWSDIEDFGWKLPTADSKSQGLLAILFIRGRRKPQRLSRNLTHFDELLELIAQKATSARVRSWQSLETRDEGEWPKVFAYRNISGWNLVGAYLGFTFVLFLLFFLQAATKGLAPMLSGMSMTWSGLGVGGKIAFVAMMLLFPGLIPLTILARYPAIKAMRRFLGERIVATREGLSFERGQQSTFVQWGDIERYELESPPGNFQLPVAVVHTKRDRYEFHTLIGNGRELRALISHRATNSSTSKWGYAAGRDNDTLGGTRSMWRGGTIGVGARIHHYRTRTNRIMLIFGALMSALFVHSAIYGRFVRGVAVPPNLGDTIGCGLFIALLLPPTVWGTIAYWYSAVEVNEEGVKQRGVWGERKLKWSEIRSAKSNGLMFEVRGEKGVMRIGPVADLSPLQEEIERCSGITIQPPKDFKIDN